MGEDVLKADAVVQPKFKEVSEGNGIAAVARPAWATVQIVHTKDVVASAEAMAAVMIRQQRIERAKRTVPSSDVCMSLAYKVLQEKVQSGERMKDSPERTKAGCPGCPGSQI